MSVQINLAANSVFGVTGLTSGRLTQANDTNTIDVNTVYALRTDPAIIDEADKPYTINLPSPGSDEEFGGSVIIFKNLTNDPDVIVTIGRMDNVFIDALDEDVITNTPGQVLSFYYVDSEIGWLAGPAVL